MLRLQNRNIWLDQRSQQLLTCAGFETAANVDRVCLVEFRASAWLGAGHCLLSAELDRQFARLYSHHDRVHDALGRALDHDAVGCVAIYSDHRRGDVAVDVFFQLRHVSRRLTHLR